VAWLRAMAQSIQTTLVFFFVLFGLKVVLRKEWIAAIVFVAILPFRGVLTGTYVAVELPTQILVYGIAGADLLRFGFVSLACAIFTVDLNGQCTFLRRSPPGT